MNYDFGFHKFNLSKIFRPSAPRQEGITKEEDVNGIEEYMK
jgi:hypothetical protein